MSAGPAMGRLRLGVRAADSAPSGSLTPRTEAASGLADPAKEVVWVAGHAGGPSQGVHCSLQPDTQPRCLSHDLRDHPRTAAFKGSGIEEKARQEGEERQRGGRGDTGEGGVGEKDPGPSVRKPR